MGNVMFEPIAKRSGDRSMRVWQRRTVVGSAAACVVLSAGVVAQAAAEFRGVRLNVSDPAAAAQWYCDHMGGTLVGPTPSATSDSSNDRGRVRAVQFGKTTLTFRPTETNVPVPGSVGSGIDHLGFGYADLDR